MQTTQKLFQVFVQRDQQRRPSRWFARESLAKRFCEEFNLQALGRQTAEMHTQSPSNESCHPSPGKSGNGEAFAIYQLVEVPVGHAPLHGNVVQQTKVVSKFRGTCLP
jgi:hypothetical protein